jgi:hypothetical protein
MPTDEDPIDRLRAQVTSTIRRGTDLLADLEQLDDRLTDRLQALVGGLADLVAGLTATDGAAAWLRHHLDRLAAGEADEAA